MKIKPIAKLEVLSILHANSRETYDEALENALELAKSIVCNEDEWLWLSSHYINTFMTRLVLYKEYGNLPEGFCAGLTNVILRSKNGMICESLEDLRKEMWKNVDDVDELGDNEEYMRED